MRQSLIRPIAPLGVALMLAVACTGDDGTASSSTSPAQPTNVSSSQPAMPRQASPTPTGPRELLPDLSSLPAYDVHIELDGQTRLLRFAATLANRGVGPVEIRPDESQPCPDGQRFASQTVYGDSDGDGAYTVDGDIEQAVVPAGCMVHHPTHDHWHFDASARYVLTTPGRSTPIVQSDKVSFCLRDSNPLPGAAGETYGECDRDSIQGISPGWGDEYSSDLDGQALPLPADLADGVYCLTLTANPLGLLREADDSNNAATVGVRIASNAASATSAPEGCVIADVPSGSP